MKPKAFNFYIDYDENIEALTDEEVGQLTRALLQYAKTGEVPEMQPIVKVAFTPMRKRIDVEFENYESKAQALSDAGKKGAEKRWQKPSSAMNDNGVAMAKDSLPIATDDQPIEKEKEDKNKNKKKLSKKDSEAYFSKFWSAYPRKVGKASALKVFERLNVTEELLEKMVKAINEQKMGDQWQEERYIPYPSTWLNQERWNDEPPKPKGKYMQRADNMPKDFGLEYLRCR